MYDITKDCYRGPATGILYTPHNMKDAKFMYAPMGIVDGHVYMSLKMIMIDGSIPPPPGSECIIEMP